MSLLKIPYDSIFDSFLSATTDFELASLDQSVAYQLMSGYLKKAVSKSYIKRLFTTSSLDKDTQTFSFELRHPTKDETDEEQIEWVTLILSKGMVVEWCEPIVKSTTNMKQFFGSKEQKLYSQAQHLSTLRDLLQDTKIDIRREIGDRGVFNNEYLENVK